MDDKWFKQQQKISGITADKIAEELGRDRSLVSRIYVGRQKMTIDQAKVFASVLSVPLAEVMERAGVLDHEDAQTIAPGYANSDAAPWTGKPADERAMRETAQSLGGERDGVTVWRVTSNAMLLSGYLTDDIILVDTHMADRAKAGDVVIAQIFERNSSSAITALRRYEPPVLVASSPDPEHQRVHIVDHKNVTIMGKIVGSWRVSK